MTRRTVTFVRFIMERGVDLERIVNHNHFVQLIITPAAWQYPATAFCTSGGHPP